MLHRIALLAAVACVGGLAGPARAGLVYNLANDWSDVNNPNGVWALDKAPGTPFTVNQSDWWANGTKQRAWADQPFPQQAHVPVWMKVTAPSQFTDPNFVDAGTVVVHGAETGRTGTEFTSVVWTSPVEGIVDIAGGAWVLKSFDRPMIWEFSKNGTSLTSGTLTQGDPYTKSNPFDFAAGSGGASALSFAVAAGDTVTLTVYRGPTAPYSTFVGLNLTITATPAAVPEPASAATLALGMGCLLPLVRRLRRRTV
ncbi:MAG: hypothetical protein K2X82_31370 [Gemmataceae bacterium]|nr:hypothetical protein [Gemmataceae bacterium]